MDEYCPGVWTNVAPVYGRILPRCMDECCPGVWTNIAPVYGRILPRCMDEYCPGVWTNLPRCMDKYCPGVWTNVASVYGRILPRCMDECCPGVWTNIAPVYGLMLPRWRSAIWHHFRYDASNFSFTWLFSWLYDPVTTATNKCHTIWNDQLICYDFKRRSFNFYYTMVKMATRFHTIHRAMVCSCRSYVCKVDGNVWKKGCHWWHTASLYCASAGDKSLQWRHNGCDSVSNHQPRDCLLNGLFRHRSKKTWKPRVTDLRVGNSPGTGEFPTQMASNAENVPIWWRHHVSRGGVLFLTFDFIREELTNWGRDKLASLVLSQNLRWNSTLPVIVISAAAATGC